VKNEQLALCVIAHSLVCDQSLFEVLWIVKWQTFEIVIESSS